MLSKNTSAILIAVALSTSACSGKSPSNSEIKSSIKEIVEGQGCRYFSMEDFKKLNGISRSEGTYQIDAEYSIKIAPSEETKKYVQGRLGEISREAIRNTTETDDDARKQEKANAAEKMLKPWIMEDIDRIVSRECPRMSNVIRSAFLSGKIPVAQYQQDIVLNFTVSLPMIKTDNGWQLDRQ